MKKNNSTIAILGLGKTGISVAKYLKKKNKEFLVYDTRENFEITKDIEKYVNNVPSFNLYYELISNRIEEYIENPPPSDWEGVFVAKTK